MTPTTPQREAATAPSSETEVERQEGTGNGSPAPRAAARRPRGKWVGRVGHPRLEAVWQAVASNA